MQTTLLLSRNFFFFTSLNRTSALREYSAERNLHHPRFNLPEDVHYKSVAFSSSPPSLAKRSKKEQNQRHEHRSIRIKAGPRTPVEEKRSGLVGCGSRITDITLQKGGKEGWRSDVKRMEEGKWSITGQVSS